MPKVAVIYSSATGNVHALALAVSEGAASALTGYSVLKADSLDEATKMAKGCPVLASNGSVEVYETFNAM